jgi:EAL domain-containing protein (putative c-di-GMP-specific phosphodiesterase class I)
MRTSTSISRVSVRTPRGRWSYRGGSTSPLTSPAGLHGRPWIGRLRDALEHDLFELHLQPIVSLHEDTVGHYEALLRLADQPGGELVAPARFLPAAERYGLIGEIDRMVITKAVAMLARERILAKATVAVNVSALTTTDRGMVDFIASTLARHRLEPSRLAIEVTETAAISDMPRARDFCGGVLELGCGLSLDDFGAGFGSFQYLKQLPFSHLKIDGDFIRSLPSSRTDQLVVRALARIVRGMGRQTIAEFVGDAPTIAMLRAYDVDYAQGFFVGPPAPLAQALAS